MTTSLRDQVNAVTTSNSGSLLRCLEFFSGIGGMHYALLHAQAPAHVIEAFDINTIANLVYMHNFTHLHPRACNIEHLPLEYFEKLAAEMWLMSPPCQPFTRGGKMRDAEDARSAGLLHLITLLCKMKQNTLPKFLVLENVLNFETSECHQKMLDMLAARGYEIEEYLVSPCDPWIGIPNNRLRYYLAARLLVDYENHPPLTPLKYTEHIYRSFGEIFGEKSKIEPKPIKDYLDSFGDENGMNMMVPERYLTEYKNYKHDIVHPEDYTSTTFTKSYGSKYIIGTGSFLQTKLLTELHHGKSMSCRENNSEIKQYWEDNPKILLSLGLRFFSPQEIARLHGFLPCAKTNGDELNVKFEFPTKVNTINTYRLLGNSLNVHVVALIIKRLLNKT